MALLGGDSRRGKEERRDGEGGINGPTIKKMYMHSSLIPRPLPDFILQLWRKIGSCEIKSGSGLGTKLHAQMNSMQLATCVAVIFQDLTHTHALLLPRSLPSPLLRVYSCQSHQQSV